MKLYRPFSWDKANHALYGAAIYIIISLAGHCIFQNTLTPLFALISAAIAGLGLEIYQSLTKSGTPDYKDAVATIVPALFFYLIQTCLML